MRGTRKYLPGMAISAKNYFGELANRSVVIVKGNWYDFQSFRERPSVGFGHAFGAWRGRSMSMSKRVETQLHNEDINAMRGKLVSQLEAATKKDTDKSKDKLLEHINEEMTKESAATIKTGTWNQFMNKITSAAGSAGEVVTSKVSLLPNIAHSKNTKEKDYSYKIIDIDKPVPDPHPKHKIFSHLTDAEYLELNKKLIRDFSEAVKQSHKDTSSCIEPLEILCLHLQKYEWKAGISRKDDLIRKLLVLRHNCDEADGVSLLVREALGLLGFHDPPTARGPRILSIDGGGTRGIVACKMLKALEKGTGKKIYELFDIICGVSTGSILAALLGFRKMPIDDVEKIYLQFSAKVFQQNIISGTKGLVSSYSYYDAKNFEEQLKILFSRRHHGVYMSDFYRSQRTPKIAIVASEVTQNRLSPYVFRSYQLPRKTLTSYQGSSRVQIWEAVRASTAAPGYFDDFILDNRVFQDGGILVNNPTQIAIHEAQKIWPDYPIQTVISLGLGRDDKFMQDHKKVTTPSLLSVKQKFDRICDSATDTELVHLTMEDLLKRNIYYRFNPYLKEQTDLADFREETFNMMKEYSRMYCRRNKRKFNDACYQLTKGKGPYHYVYDYLKLHKEIIKGQYF